MDDSDPFFGLGYEAGLFVWRMAGVRPRLLDEEQLGTFKSCACYIVAEATRPSCPPDADCRLVVAVP